jgi:hypothetical protein
MVTDLRRRIGDRDNLNISGKANRLGRCSTWVIRPALMMPTRNLFMGNL